MQLGLKVLQANIITLSICIQVLFRYHLNIFTIFALVTHQIPQAGVRILRVKHHSNKSKDDSRNLVMEESRQGSGRQARGAMRKEGEEEQLCHGTSKCQTLPCATTAPGGAAPHRPPGRSTAWAREVHSAQKTSPSHHATQSPSFNRCREERRGKSTPGSPVMPERGPKGDPGPPPAQAERGRQVRPRIPTGVRSQKAVSI